MATAIALAIILVLLLLLFFLLIAAVAGIVRLKRTADRIRQNDKPEPTRKHDYIIRKKNASHGGPHPHIVYDKYTDKKGKKRFKAVAVSHEWKSRKGRNPLELKKGVNPANRKEKAFVIHEIVDDDAEKFRKSRKYMSYSVHPKDKKRLRNAIDKWEKETEGDTEPFPKDRRTRRIIRKQKEGAKKRAVMKKYGKKDASTKKGA